MNTGLLIIGGGPGGYSAAIRAAQLGERVTLIEKDEIGGTCLNRGCIPTKFFYKNVRVLSGMKSSEEFGICLSDYSIDFEKMQEKKQKIITQMKSGMEKLIKSYKIERIKGNASFKDSKTIIIKNGEEERHFTGKNILIATGSIPFDPHIPGINLPGVINSEEILKISKIPKSLAIIGGGVIGIEFAGIYNAMDTRITVLELMPSILPKFDKEIAKRLSMSLKRRGIKIDTDVEIEEINQIDSGLRVRIRSGKNKASIDVENVLISTGRKMNTHELNLDAAGIIHDKNGIKVDSSYKTNIKGIFAIGDVIGGPMLAHVASEEGKAVAEIIMSSKCCMDYKVIPTCIYSFPEAAGVGITEEQAIAQKIPYITGKFFFGANGKALAMQEGEGLVKVIAHSETKELLGVHIVGPHASDLIHEGAVSIKNRLKAEDISKTIHAHPTLSEVFLEAILGLDGRSVYMK